MDKIESYLLRGIQTLGPSLLGKPIITTVLNAFLREVQEAEDVLFDIFERYNLDTADRVGLISLGKIVGQQPRDYSDETFRRAIRARIAANKSSGTSPDILNVIHLLFDDPLAVMFQRNMEHKALLVVISTVPPEGSLNAGEEIIPLARPGGNRVMLNTRDQEDIWVDGYGSAATWEAGTEWWYQQSL